MGLLIGISVFTYGFGGLAYYFARRKHRICAQCGLGWERARIPGPGFAGHPPFAGSVGADLVGRVPERGPRMASRDEAPGAGYWASRWCFSRPS